MNTIAIIQARMGSSRLPGKVLKGISGKPMLSWVVERVLRSREINGILVATSDKASEEPIIELCKGNAWNHSRGSEDDVLDRYYKAAKSCDADNIVRVTSDCPLIDPDIIDLVCRSFAADDSIDYASNTIPPRTYPRGLDVEVMSFTSLEKAWLEDNKPEWREHVTPYIYNHPESFGLLRISSDIDYSYYRWTVDTHEDLALIRRIFDHFGDSSFGWTDVIWLMEKNPELEQINRHVQQKEVSSG